MKYETGRERLRKCREKERISRLLKRRNKIATWPEPKRKEFREAVTDLKKILKKHEDDEANLYLLCYFADPKAKPTGVFVFDKESRIERRVFNRCANIKLNMKTIDKPEKRRSSRLGVRTLQ